MSFLVSRKRWYIIVSTLTIICIVNLVLAIVVPSVECNIFVLKCPNILTHWIYWIVVVIGVISFIILVGLLYHVLKLRKSWESDNEGLRRRDKDITEMRRMHYNGTQPIVVQNPPTPSTNSVSSFQI